MEEWFVRHDYVRCMKAEWYSLAPGISMLPKDNRPAFQRCAISQRNFGGRGGFVKAAYGLGPL